MIHLITYGNYRFAKSKILLCKQANQCGWFDTVTSYGPEDLDDNFKTEFGNILKQPRGAGYWIWKFDIIKQNLKKLEKNDILIYIDAGCTININGKPRFNEYIEMLNTSNETIISFQMEHLERNFTTKEIFSAFGMDINDNNGSSGQIVGGILIMKNTEKMMKMIDECIDILRKDHLLVTDYYNRNNQCSDFFDNRHDQSILSLTRKKYGSIILGDETWFTPFGSKESLKYPFWATRKKY